MLTLLAEFTELPTNIKIKQIKLLVESDDENNIDIFKKQLESVSVDQVRSNETDISEYNFN